MVVGWRRVALVAQCGLSGQSLPVLYICVHFHTMPCWEMIQSSSLILDGQEAEPVPCTFLFIINFT